MIREIKDFNRLELFNHYHKGNNPFIIVTTKIDITNVINYCKVHKNFYMTLGYLITKTVKQIDAFKYRYKDGRIYYCDEIISGYTQMFEDKTIGYFSIPDINNYDEYKIEFLKTQKEFFENQEYNTENEINEIWLSCAPWFSFTSLIPPFKKEVTIPQFIWDKYECVNERYYVNLMIMVHHGFADGYHIGQFINLLEENINNFN